MVTLVAFLSRFLPKVTMEGKVSMVPGIDVDQTHPVSLESKSTITGVEAGTSVQVY